MALAANKVRTFKSLDKKAQHPVKAAAVIYQGSAVGRSGSVVRALVAGDQFLGFSEAKVDNTDGADAAVDVRVVAEGRAELVVTGVDGVDDIGKAVYASDDGTFTLTASTNSPIGRVSEHVSSTTCIVDFAPATQLTALTDNSGGTADGTLAAVGGLTALTDSTGQSGTHDDTLAATTVPAALTGGESPTEAEHNAVLTLLGVMVQNQSDVAQKVNELVADMEDCKNNFADIAAQIKEIKAHLNK